MTDDTAKPSAGRTLTWRDWFDKHRLTQLCEFPADLWSQPWDPTPDDRKAAWELYTEVRTRIATQPLHYRSGVEKTALESIVQLFRLTRELLRKYGPQSRHFATICVEVINVRIRPFTARWHKWSEAGRLDGDDGRHEFRGELWDLQGQLREFLRLLGLLSEGDAFVVGTESGFRTVSQQVVPLGDPIRFDQLLGLPSPPSRSADSEAILAAEQQEVADRRRAAGLTDGADDLVGMAISGGGIRSATFALGVVQGIAAKGLLREVDLLSTVSGGGYLGCFLSSYLNDADSPDASRPDIGPGPDQLPFGRHGTCESGPLRFLRNHSKYLLPSGFLGRLTMVGQGLYGVLMNLVILSPLLTGGVLITRWLYLDKLRGMGAAVEMGSPPPLEWTDFAVTICVAAVWGVLVFFLPLVQKLSRISARLFALRTSWETLCVGLFGVTLAVALVQAVPLGYYAFLRLNEQLGLLTPELTFTPASMWVLLGNVVTFLSARGLLWPPKETGTPHPPQASLIRKLAFLLLALAGPLLLIVVYFLLCHRLLVVPGLSGVEPGSAAGPGDVVLLALFLVPLVYCFGFLNVNVISPQRYYRNRLAETYMLRPGSAEGEAAAVVDPQLLSHLGRTKKAPYHLINAALNLPASRVPDLRGRDADFFLFSKHYCGSPIVGYFATGRWEKLDGYLDLGTAVAISGAAASPHMGATTPRGASFFLTLLNVRLGYWLRQPGVPAQTNFLARALRGPGPMNLFREMFGWVHERSRYLNVSDGGHIENLAVYELLRRRCKFIIAIDGECDPRLEFPSLMKLQRYAWIDFGTRIDLDVARLRLTDRGWSQAHIAFGTITYPGGEQGFLLYIKLSVTGNERDDLLDYRLRNSPFPHESTANQLFSEAQFEAYRALGEHVTEHLFCEQFWSPAAGQPHTVKDWFQALANNLLDPA